MIGIIDKVYNRESDFYVHPVSAAPDSTIQYRKNQEIESERQAKLIAEIRRHHNNAEKAIAKLENLLRSK